MPMVMTTTASVDSATMKMVMMATTISVSSAMKTKAWTQMTLTPWKKLMPWTMLTKWTTLTWKT